VRQENFDQQIRVLEKHRAGDNEFLAQRSFDGDRIFNRIFSSDIDQDSHDELIVDGFIGILKPTDLKTEREGDFSGASIAMIADVDGDPGQSPEIVLTHRDSLYVVDSSMNVRLAAHAETGDEFYAAAHFTGPTGNHYLAVVLQTGAPTRHNAVTIYELKPGSKSVSGETFSGGGRLSWLYIPAVLIVGAAAGLLVGLRRKGSPMRPKTAEYDNLLTSLVNFDHGQMAGRNLNRLEFLLANLPNSPEKLDEIKPNIKAAVEAYQSLTSDQLDHIARHVQRLKPLQHLTVKFNQSKKKLDEIVCRLALGNLSATDSDRLRSAVPEAIRKIKEDIAQVRKSVLAQYSADLLRVIPTVLAGTVTLLRENGVGFRNITVHGAPMRLVFFDEAELMAIFEELLSNACDALADSERKELALLIDFGVEQVVIRLSDSGRGLKGAGPETLFQRGFSTKPGGGGYGLYHAHQQVERFGGRLRLYNNPDGSGATAELILKTVNRE